MGTIKKNLGAILKMRLGKSALEKKSQLIIVFARNILYLWL